jgi:hypothetical protein
VTSNILTEEAMVAAALRAELGIDPKADLDQLAAQLGLTIVEVAIPSPSKVLCYGVRAISLDVFSCAEGFASQAGGVLRLLTRLVTTSFM